MSSKKQSYQDRAERLAKTVDIAESVIKASDTLSEDIKSRMLQWGQQVKQMGFKSRAAIQKSSKH